MWVVVDTSTTHVVCRHFYLSYLIPHLHICSDWLIIKKANIQSSVWATVTKLGIWVVVGTSTARMVCCHQMHMFDTSFAYLFWLANNKKRANIQSSDETWYVGSCGRKFYQSGLSSPNGIFNTSFAYLFWLAYNNKGKYSQFCMGYSDKTWYVGSGGQKYYPCGLWSLNAHIWYPICISYLIG